MPDAPWHLAPVPPDRWQHFTSLKPVEGVQMLTRSDLLEECAELPDAVDLFCELMDGDLTYPVALHCLDCGALQHFEANAGQDGDEYDEMFQLHGLDERMKPWLDQHTSCRYQLRLPLEAAAKGEA